MELNEMKSLWEKTNKISERTKIAEEKIIKMLKKSYKGSMNSLINYELLGLIFVLPAAGLLFYILSIEILQNFLFIEILKWIFVAVCIIGFLWQIYKYNFLKKIEIANMDIISVSQKVLTYRKYIIQEVIIGVIFFIAYIIPLMYFMYNLVYKGEVFLPLIVFYIAVFVVGIVLMLLLYKYLYFENIKKVQESLAEIEEFKEDMEKE